MTHSPSTFIAPHLREHIFRTYEDCLRAAVANFPSETTFTVPPGVASATFVGHLRNAVISLQRYHWTTDVDTTKLFGANGVSGINNPRAFSVTIDAATQKVIFGPVRKPAPRVLQATFSKVDRPAPPPTIAASPSSSLVPWGDYTDDELRALCLLLDRQRLVGPFFLSGSVPDSHVESYQDEFNVALVYDKERNLTIIT